MTFTFSKATKTEARARVAVTGPSGAGKTFWALRWATVLADGGDIAVIDTERGSASLYADQFDFYTLPLTPPYHPNRLIEALAQAEGQFAVVVVDSLTHFWAGKGGVLEIVDAAKARFKGNSHAAWQEGTPLHQAMVDALLAYSGHTIGTMRSKSEWLMEQGSNGKVTPVKVGLAPQQRDGIEFEFTLMLDIDMEHRAIVGKSRAAQLAGRVFSPDEDESSAREFLAWLSAGERLASRDEVAAIVAKFEVFDDVDYRKSRKTDFLEQFGRPDQLPAAQVDAALLFFEEEPFEVDSSAQPVDTGEAPSSDAGGSDDQTHMASGEAAGTSPVSAPVPPRRGRN